MPTKEDMLNFALEIEAIVQDTEYTYLEAIVEYCTKNSIEIEVVVSLITSNLKAKIESDASDLNLLKDKGARLPI